MHRLYLFDLDGTLMSSTGAGARAFERAFRAVFAVADALVDVALDGNTDPSILEEACRHKLGRGPSADEAERTLARYLVYLGEEMARPGVVRVMPAVREVLGALQAGGALAGLATGNLAAGARIKLEAADLWRHFPFGGFGSDSQLRPALVEVAIERAERHAGTALDRRSIAVIGDTPRDVAAARAVGVRAIAVATGRYDRRTLAGAGADEVHDTLATLLA